MNPDVIKFESDSKVIADTAANLLVTFIPNTVFKTSG
jgi:hypothetical protein